MSLHGKKRLGLKNNKVTLWQDFGTPSRIWTLKYFVPLLIASLNRMLHLDNVNFLKARQKINMDIIWHRGITIRVLFFGTILCLSITSKLLNLVWLWMAWIVLSKDKEFAYGTTWEVCNKNSECYKCTNKTMKTIHNYANKSLSQCTQYMKHLHYPYDGDIFAIYVL